MAAAIGIEIDRQIKTVARGGLHAETWRPARAVAVDDGDRVALAQRRPLQLEGKHGDRASKASVHPPYGNARLFKSRAAIGGLDGDVVHGGGIARLKTPGIGHEVLSENERSPGGHRQLADRVGLPDRLPRRDGEGTGIGRQREGPDRARILIMDRQLAHVVIDVPEQPPARRGIERTNARDNLREVHGNSLPRHGVSVGPFPKDPGPREKTLGAGRLAAQFTFQLLDALAQFGVHIIAAAILRRGRGADHRPEAASQAQRRNLCAWMVHRGFLLLDEDSRNARERAEVPIKLFSPPS